MGRYYEKGEVAKYTGYKGGLKKDDSPDYEIILDADPRQPELLQLWFHKRYTGSNKAKYDETLMHLAPLSEKINYAVRR